MLWEGGNRKNGTTAGSKSNVESLICINRCYNHGSRQDRPVAIKLRAFGCLQPQLLWWCHLVNAHEGKAGMVLLAGKLCDPYLSAVCVHWCKKALYKILFLSFPFLTMTPVTVDSLNFPQLQVTSDTLCSSKCKCTVNVTQNGPKHM